LWSLLSNQKELVKLVIGVISNTLFPSLNFYLVVFSQILAKR